jgi:Putative sensor
VAASFVGGHAVRMTTFAANPSRFAPLPGLATVGRDFLYLVLGLPLGIATFTFAVTALALSAGLAITLVGIPLLVLTLLASRWIARFERERARLVVDEPIAADRPLAGGAIERSKALLRDRSAWTGAAWSVLLLPIGTAGFTVAVTLWSTALGFVTSPLWFWALPPGDDTIPLLDSTSAGYSALRVLIGLALLPTTATACRGLAAATGRAARAILG